MVMASSRPGRMLDAAQDFLSAAVLPYWAAVRRSRSRSAARRAGEPARPTARRASTHDLGLVTGKPGGPPPGGGEIACPCWYAFVRPSLVRAFEPVGSRWLP